MTAKSPPRRALATVIGKGRAITIYKADTVSKGKSYRSYMISYADDVTGRRVRERAPTEAAARKRARELIASTAEEIWTRATPLKPAQTKSVLAAVEILAPLQTTITDAARTVAEAQKILGGKGTIQEAARFFAKKAARDEIEEITFGDLYRKFMDELATGNDPQTREYQRSYRYWQDCSHRLGAAADFFKTTPITAITSRDLEDFLNRIPLRVRTAKGIVYTGKYSKARGRNRKNYRTALCTLLSYARDQRYLPRDVKTEAEYIRDPGEARRSPEEVKRNFYRAEEMQKILDELPERWLPVPLLGAFAGVRMSEIHRLRWEDVNWRASRLEVEAHKAKTGRRRYVVMSDQLVAWLKPLAEESGFIAPHFSHDATFNIEFAKARNPIAVRKIRNGHRDSYASYRLWELKNEAQVAYEMGTSPRKLRDNYAGLVDDEDLAAWKKVLPREKKPKKKKV